MASLNLDYTKEQHREQYSLNYTPHINPVVLNNAKKNAVYAVTQACCHGCHRLKTKALK